MGGVSVRTLDYRLLAGFGLAILGLIFLLRGLHGEPTHSDFRGIWIAGHIWAQGQDAYGPLFVQRGVALFGQSHNPVMWPYPPHAWLLALGSQRFDLSAGLFWWNLMGAALAAIGAWLLGQAFAADQRARLVLAIAVFSFVAFSTASGGAMRMGQTGFIAFFGLGLLAWAMVRRKIAVAAVAISILMLKPQIGLVACGALLVVPDGLAIVAGGAAIALGASLPVLFLTGPATVAAGYLHNLALYRTIPYDLPRSMTGIGNLVAQIAGVDLPAIGMTFVGAAVAALLVRLHRWRNADDPSPVALTASLMMAIVGATVGFAFLHIYDLMIVAPAVALVPMLRGGARWSAIVGLAMLVRPENIAHILLLHGQHGEATVASIGCLTLFTGAVANALMANKPQQSDDAEHVPLLGVQAGFAAG